ncbi:nucleotidyltransferase domain-containing protein [Candidatus Woesearchaeota archaeon]|nr:nucleotidyltransferase domain-containing protein [Candidatus Woesearchaeota archaeon]
MGSESKENNILKLILENSPTRQWHFEEVVKQSKVTRAAANKWLKKYCKNGLLKRVKESGKFPYFTAGSNNPAYQARKKLYALNELHQSGLITGLMSLKNAKAIIVFGSMAKGDWYKGSDIDIFIYGSPEGLEKEHYEKKLKKRIELHVFESKKEIKQVKTGLISNVVNGYIIKGQVQDFASIG